MTAGSGGRAGAILVILKAAAGAPLCHRVWLPSDAAAYVEVAMEAKGF